MPAAPSRVTLPEGVLSGHNGHLPLPPPYSARQLVGQLVEVQDDAGNHYLLGETETHYVLHRRVTPDADGPERNRLEVGPPIAREKPPDE